MNTKLKRSGLMLVIGMTVAATVASAGMTFHPVTPAFRSVPEVGFAVGAQSFLGRPENAGLMATYPGLSALQGLDPHSEAHRLLLAPLALSLGNADEFRVQSPAVFAAAFAAAQAQAQDEIPALVSEVVQHAASEGMSADELERELRSFSNLGVYGPAAAELAARRSELALHEYRAGRHAEAVAAALRADDRSSGETEEALTSVEELSGHAAPLGLSKARAGEKSAPRSSWLKEVPKFEAGKAGAMVGRVSPEAGVFAAGLSYAAYHGSRLLRKSLPVVVEKLNDAADAAAALSGVAAGLIVAAHAVAAFLGAAAAVLLLHATMPWVAAAIAVALGSTITMASETLHTLAGRLFFHPSGKGFMRGFSPVVEHTLIGLIIVGQLSLYAAAAAALYLQSWPIYITTTIAGILLWRLKASGGMVDFLKSASGFAAGAWFAPLTVAVVAAVAGIAAGFFWPAALTFGPLLAASAATAIAGSAITAALVLSGLKDWIDYGRFQTHGEPERPFVQGLFTALHLGFLTAVSLAIAGLGGVAFLGLSALYGAATGVASLALAATVAQAVYIPATYVVAFGALALVMGPIGLMMAEASEG